MDALPRGEGGEFGSDSVQECGRFVASHGVGITQELVHHAGELRRGRLEELPVEDGALHFRTGMSQSSARAR